MRKLLEMVARPLGLRVVKAQRTDMIYQHQYQGGYDEYRAIQIFNNKRKITQVWADEQTLSAIADDIETQAPKARGLCHGARNGFEVAWLRERLGGDILGTDISETATEFDNMVTWDFHEVNPEWVGKFDFVYTNSLDQAMDPAQALSTWADQLSDGGRIYIEHTMGHAADKAGERDPFGAHPMAMPYLIFKWGRGRYELVNILEIEQKQNNSLRAWVFVLSRVAAPAASA